MAALAVVDLNTSAGDYPFAKTKAKIMLHDALEAYTRDKDTSQREVAKILGYKTSVVLSHMALGRVPIPIDRAADFARVLKMPTGEFLVAVLEQRHPDIDWLRHIAGAAGKRSATAGKATQSFVADELESLAGVKLDELPQQVVNILRDVVADRNAPRRWLALHEMPVLELLRKHHPDGLNPTQRKALDGFLESL